MVMIRPKGKALKIAKQVMKGEGIKVRNAQSIEKLPQPTPYLQH